MSYMLGGSARALADYLEASAEAEELELPKGKFIAKMGRAYKIALSIASCVSLVIGIPTTFVWHEDVPLAVSCVICCVRPTNRKYTKLTPWFCFVV